MGAIEGGSEPCSGARSAARARGVAWATGCALVLLLAANCGAAQRYDGRVYQDEQLSIRTPPVPASWRRIDVTAADLAFRDDAADASILLNGRCGGKDDDVPLASLTNHLIIGTTEREIVSQTTVPFDGREAMHTVLRAKLDGVRMQYDLFVVKKDGCVYDFVYVAPPERFTQGALAFEQFVAQIHTARADGS